MGNIINGAWKRGMASWPPYPMTSSPRRDRCIVENVGWWNRDQARVMKSERVKAMSSGGWREEEAVWCGKWYIYPLRKIYIQIPPKNFFMVYSHPKILFLHILWDGCFYKCSRKKWCWKNILSWAIVHVCVFLWWMKYFLVFVSVVWIYL